jgi:hypothetical protein
MVPLSTSGSGGIANVLGRLDIHTHLNDKIIEIEAIKNNSIL